MKVIKLFALLILILPFASCGGGDADKTIPVTGVTLNKSTLALKVGLNETLTATIIPSTATNQNVTWTSSNNAVATVSSGGSVTALAVGSAIITVMTADGNKSASCSVTVSAATVSATGVTLNKSTLSIPVGSNETLTATVSPSNVTNTNVSWSSSDATIATVANGKVTAVKAGTATITVKTEDGGYTATCAVTVTIPVTGVTLNKSTLALVAGSSATLAATITPEDATNKSVTWSSSDTSIATVSDGKVTAVKAGTATITVTTTDGSKTATCAVTVVANNNIPYNGYNNDVQW
jgi:uncharacterized protein YjdB